MKTFGVVWLLAVGMFAARPAEAESIRGAFALKGDLNAADVAAVTRATTERMQVAGWAVGSPLDKKDTQQLLDCLDAVGACFPKPLQVRGYRGAITYEAKTERSANGERIVVLAGKIVLSERPEFLVVVRRCDACNDDTLVKAAAALADELLQQLAVQVGRTLVSVRSNPPGANVHFDSTLAGATPTMTKTFPGTHVVRIEKDGYRTAERTVVATDGTTQELIVELDPEGGKAIPGSVGPVAPKSDPRDERGKPWGPIAMVAGGAVLVAGGGYLLYLGQRSEGEHLYRYPRATTIGAITGVVGLGLAGFGGWLWWRDSKKTHGPTVDATGTSAVVGWGGTF